jgi:hypothetical protein
MFFAKKENVLLDNKDADGCHGDKGKQVPHHGRIFVPPHQPVMDILPAHDIVNACLGLRHDTLPVGAGR